MNKRIFSSLFLPNIPYEKIYFRLGYPSKEKVLPKQKEQIEELCQKILKIWHPQGILATEEVKQFHENGIATKSLFIPGKELAKKFEKSKKITFMAVTVGKEAMDFRESFKKEQYTNFVLSDAILSELADGLAQSLNNIVQREAHQQGYHLTFRFSPGYGDLPLSFQKKLLNFLEGFKIGISLNNSFLMNPEKSVTALLGWLKK